MENFEIITNKVKSEGLYPSFLTIESGVNEPVCKIGGKEYLLFCANNYLGMTQNKDVKKAAIESVKKYGVGPGGSRVISGNVDVIEKLERSIADLTGTDDCITFPTGYMANVAIFMAVMDPVFGSIFGDDALNNRGGVIFSDEHNHGSIIDGCRLSTAKKVIFKHNDLDDLQKKITLNDLPNKLIVTEGVFSLEGEITPIPKFVELAKKTNSMLMVDDAHGVGIVGEHGGGVGEYFGCSKDIDIYMGCMDKAFGGTGGFLCGKKTLIDFLRISTRSSLLSSSITTEMAGAMLKAVELIKGGEGLRKKVFESSQYLRDSLIKNGFKVLGSDNIPSVPLFVGTDSVGVQFEKRLFDRGVYLPVVRWPAVPYGTSRFRIIVMAQHSKKQLDQLIENCIQIGKELEII